MEFLPVGKRTRGQKAKILKEQKKRLCLAARKKWMEIKGKSLEVHNNNGGKKVEALDDDDDDDDDDDAMVIDEDEYLKAVNKGRSEKTWGNEGIMAMGIVKKEIFDGDDDENENPLFNVVNNGNESSDDSVQIVGERWNPLEAELCFDLDDEDVRVSGERWNPLEAELCFDLDDEDVRVSGEKVGLIDFELSSSDGDGDVDDGDGDVDDGDGDGDGDVDDDDSVVPSEKDGVELPRKFRLGGEKVEPKKSEYEQESDYFFKELDFVLNVCDIGGKHSSLNEKKEEEAVICDSVASQVKLCREGKHYLILDEEIGIKCEFCSIVMHEIRDVTPAFV